MISSDRHTAWRAPIPCTHAPMETRNNGHQPTGIKEYRIVDFWSDGPFESAIEADSITIDSSATVASAYAQNTAAEDQSWARRLLNWL